MEWSPRRPTCSRTHPTELLTHVVLSSIAGSTSEASAVPWHLSGWICSVALFTFQLGLVKELKRQSKPRYGVVVVVAVSESEVDVARGGGEPPPAIRSRVGMMMVRYVNQKQKCALRSIGAAIQPAVADQA